MRKTQVRSFLVELDMFGRREEEGGQGTPSRREILFI
jgi:hypothetical protein